MVLMRHVGDGECQERMAGETLACPDAEFGGAACWKCGHMPALTESFVSME